MHRFFVGLLCLIGLLACRPDMAADQQRHLAIKDSVRRADSLQARYLYDSLAGRLPVRGPDSVATDMILPQPAPPASVAPERLLPAPRPVESATPTRDTPVVRPVPQPEAVAPDTTKNALPVPEIVSPQSPASALPRSRNLPPPIDSTPAASPDSSQAVPRDSTGGEN